MTIKLPSPSECSHKKTTEATDHDDVPNGTVVCVVCGKELESPSRP